MPQVTGYDEGMNAMAYVQAELARQRRRSMLAVAAAEREVRQARLYSRVIRQAERAERRQLTRRDEAIRLRAWLEQFESAG
jgi:RNA binding exosome subunit